MPRTTIDFGIDLGTTNSEIAVANKGKVRVLRNVYRHEATPSVVRLDQLGAVVVGKLAYDHRIDDDDNTKAGFKRLMGSESLLHFERKHWVQSPEELSAEVLKSLRQDARRETGEDVQAAVITIPAMFLAPQCNATQRAAALAGIRPAPLLQEPVAAALAYCTEEEADGFLAVYDLGGGTFDFSILKSDEESFAVINHGGDNQLGGKDFDELLADHFLERLVRDFGLRLDLRDDREKAAKAKLLAAAEEAKIALSVADQATVTLLGLGPQRAHFEASFTVERAVLDHLIAPKIEATMATVRALLAESRLSPSAIRHVVLVGGPTLMPYVRGAVAEVMGREPEYNVDPITVVAQGAALFAARQRLQVPSAARAAVPGAVPVVLAYDEVSPDLEAVVGGRFGGSAEVARVEIVRGDNGWRSGAVPISDRSFLVSVPLTKRSNNGFALAATDAKGNAVRLDPDRFEIRHGPMIENAPLSVSIRIGLDDNSTMLLVPKGTPVPYSSAKPALVATSRTLAAGSSGDLLQMPILQGENERSDRNSQIGVIKVAVEEIRRSLPSNAEVQISVKITSDFQFNVAAFVPLLDQRFDSVCEFVSPKPQVKEIAEALDFEEARLRAAAAEGSTAAAVRDLAGEVRTHLGRARGDDDAAQRAQQGIEKLRARIDELETSARWPALVQRCQAAIEFAREAVGANGTAHEKQALAQMLEDAARAQAGHDFAQLELRIERIESLAYGAHFRADGAWVAACEYLAEHRNDMSDQRQADGLLEEAKLAVARNDFGSLRSIVGQLWQLMPDSAAAQGPLRYQSDVRRHAAGQA